MPRRPTAWSLGHIVPCSQRSWNPSPLEQNKARQPEDGLQPFSSDGQNCLTSHHVYHPFQHGHPQPTTSLVNGGHGGPVLVKGVEALHAAQCPAVTPTAALQPSVSSCRMDTGQVDVHLATVRSPNIIRLLLKHNLWHRGISWLSFWVSFWMAGADCTSYFPWEIW